MNTLSKISARMDIVRAAYKSFVIWSKSVGHLSDHCSTNIEDHFKASPEDYSFLGTCADFASVVGEYHGLAIALDAIKKAGREL